MTEPTAPEHQHCPNPHCGDQGFSPRQINDRGDAEQEQCEFCYTVPDSWFNVRARLAAPADTVSRAAVAQIADAIAEDSTRISEECWNEGDHDTAKIRMGWSNGAQAVAAAIRALPPATPAGPSAMGIADSSLGRKPIILKEKI